jgi:hypothetical protein
MAEKSLSRPSPDRQSLCNNTGGYGVLFRDSRNIARQVLCDNQTEKLQLEKATKAAASLAMHPVQGRRIDQKRFDRELRVDALWGPLSQSLSRGQHVWLTAEFGSAVKHVRTTLFAASEYKVFPRY